MAKRKEKSRKIVPNDKEMRSDDGMSQTNYRKSDVSGIHEESKGQDNESYMDDVINQTLSESDYRVKPEEDTISTQRRVKNGDTKVYTERNVKPSPRDLAKYRAEPERPVNSQKWLENALRIRTIMLDEEVVSRMEEPHPGMQLVENLGRSEPSTEKTIEQ